MTETTKWITIVSVTCTALAAILGVVVYIRQQKIKSLQNLVSVFHRFTNNDDFLGLFSMCDSCYVRLNKTDKAAELNQYLEHLKKYQP